MVKTAEDLANYHIECASELELLQNKADENNNFKHAYESGGDAKCYLNCSLTKAGLFHPEKGFNVDNTVKQLVNNHKINDIEILRAQIAECFDTNDAGSDACEWAFRGATCMVNSNLHMIRTSLGRQTEVFDVRDFIPTENNSEDY